jgi:hypothetical protein
LLAFASSSELRPSRTFLVSVLRPPLNQGSDQEESSKQRVHASGPWIL